MPPTYRRGYDETGLDCGGAMGVARGVRDDADDSAVVPGFRCHISSVARSRSSCLADCPAVMLTGRRDQFDAAMAGRPMLAR